MATELIAPGVWVVKGGFPVPTMNVFLLEESGGGVTMFDAGVKSMVKQLSRTCASKGGLQRIVLGHGHPDHRGAAPELAAPVYCHADGVADTEGDGGRGAMDLSKLGPHGRLTMPLLLRHWDGGPVPVTGTVGEGDDICGFKVVDIPGHASGQVALFRESDGLALTSDCFYTLDPQTGIKGAPRLPHPAFNVDEEATRQAVLRVAELDPRTAWPGHADPLQEDVQAVLRKVASANDR
jgi:glyoxylase-like metal-dependent hydrolase (beta-lactamase superfamily II)